MDPGSDPEAFVLTPWDLLMTSLSVNVCLLLQVILSRVIDWTAAWLRKGSPLPRALWEIHQRWPSLLGRLLMEQVSLLFIIVIILVHVSSTSILPFSQQPLQQSTTLLRLVFNASTARLIVMAIQSLFGKENETTGQSSSGVRHVTRYVSQSKVNVAYMTFCIASNIIYLGSRQNLILGLTTPFMELGSIPFIVCRLINLSDSGRVCESYRKYTVLNFGACVVARFILPLVLLALALSQESPLVMDYLALTWFFVAMVFHASFHILFLYQCLKLMIKDTPPSAILPDQRTSCTEGNAPFSIHDYPDLLSNDINGIVLPYNKKDPCFSSEIVNATPTATKLKDLNYGFLRCYDNRNLYSSVVSEKNEKMNFHRKKSTSKYVLLNTSDKQAERVKSSNINNRKGSISCFDEDVVDPNDGLQGLLDASILSQDCDSDESGNKTASCLIRDQCDVLQRSDEILDTHTDRRMSLTRTFHDNDVNTWPKTDVLPPDCNENKACSDTPFQDLAYNSRKDSPLPLRQNCSPVCLHSNAISKQSGFVCTFTGTTRCDCMQVLNRDPLPNRTNGQTTDKDDEDT